mmetsp:Transcript_28633/g.43253  ORF Transcript_28633/g.43253 Transcript_28633/m.43253 type:complete len:337 (+) Transcript_28633:46-1056(+)
MDEEGEELPAAVAALRQEILQQMMDQDGEEEVPPVVAAVRQELLRQIFQPEGLEFANALFAAFGNENNVVENYVYSGGRPPRNVGSVIIDNSVREIPREAFASSQLTGVEFGNMLDRIEQGAFEFCALRGVTIPSVRSVGVDAFYRCQQLEYAVFGVDLEYVGRRAFGNCNSLRRITIPLKDIIIDDGAFHCDNLTTVDLVGADDLQKTISSLHMERWTDEINQEINRINRGLPGLEDWEKTSEIVEWSERVRRKLNRHKREHQVVVKEAMTLLELALWKAKLDEAEGEEDGNGEAALEFQPKKARIDVDSARKALRITSGTNVIIKNVLPFLKLV